MKIGVGPQGFRGELPRYGAQRLPDGFGQTAQNTRLLSGDLEPWKALGSPASPPGSTLAKGGSIRTFHQMRRSNPVWLHWNTTELSSSGTPAVNVDVARSPVLGDETELTVYTGTDLPRITNIAMAIQSCGGLYPCASWKLGVPAPTAAPTVTQEFGSAGASIPITNPGAETGITGWTVEAGDLQSVDTVPPGPKSGLKMFSGGAGAAVTTASQRINAQDVFIAPGNKLKLAWWQAGDGVDMARMGLRFLRQDTTQIEDTKFLDFKASTATWEQRDFIIPVPAETFYIDIVQDYQRVGGTDIEAYIDDITLNNEGVSYTNRGDNSAGWTIDAQNGFEFDATTGNPAPAWKLQTNTTVTSQLSSGDLAIDKTPRMELNVDFALGGTANNTAYGWRMTKFGMNGSGVGPAALLTTLDFTTQYLYLGYSTGGNSHDIQDPIYVLLDPLIAGGTWHNLTIAAASVGENTFDVTATVRNSEGTVVGEVTKPGMTFSGGRIGFLHYMEVGANDTGQETWHIDNITVNAAPETLDPTRAIETARFTSYVYTFVNELGQEGAPSDPSRTVRYTNDGLIVNQITMETSTTAGHGVNTGETPDGKKRIYRAVTSEELGTVYAFVAEVPVSQETYTDNSTDEDLGELLPSAGWALPPVNGRGILALPNGITCMFDGNQFCPSVQNRVHAYPINFRLATDYPIVGQGAIDTVAVVVTESNPYLVQGSTPETLSMQKLELPQGCVSKRSIVNLKGHGVIYASPDGLVGVSGTAAPRVLTEGIISRREWQALNPSSIIAIAHDDRYFGFYDNGSTQAGFIFDPRGADGFGFVRLNIYATAAFSDALTDTLYLYVGGSVQVWEGASTTLSYIWKSRLWHLPRPASFEIAQVKASDYTSLVLKVYVGGALFSTHTIANSQEFNLPAGVPNENWEIQLEGTSRVQSVELAEDAGELE